MSELEKLASALRVNARVLESQRGVPYQIGEKLCNIADRMDELAVEHEVLVEFVRFAVNCCDMSQERFNDGMVLLEKTK